MLPTACSKKDISNNSAATVYVRVIVLILQKECLLHL